MNHKLTNSDLAKGFLEEALAGRMNGIAKKYVPEGKPGDKLRFYDGGRCVAVAKISRVEEPTATVDRWLVFWDKQSFQLTK